MNNFGRRLNWIKHPNPGQQPNRHVHRKDARIFLRYGRHGFRKTDIFHYIYGPCPAWYKHTTITFSKTLLLQLYIPGQLINCFFSNLILFYIPITYHPSIMAPSLSLISDSDSDSLDVTKFAVYQGNGVKGLSELGLKTLPKQYIQPVEERMSSMSHIEPESIPIIDMANWDDPKVILGEYSLI